MLKLRKTLSGGLIPGDLQDGLNKGRRKETVAYMRTVSNRMFYITIVSVTMAIFCAYGWHQADKRFAENVKVAYVKMYPGGHYDVQYEEADKPVDYFATTVESKLEEFVEKRYSKRRDTINTDYGFAKLMMSPEMQVDFMQNYKAAEEAAKVIKCSECDQITTKAREVQPFDKDLLPNSRRHNQYTTIIFATDQIRNKDGKLLECKNKIVTVIWKIRPIEATAKKRDELKYNPLGQEIIRSDVRDDPTTVNLRDCIKL